MADYVRRSQVKFVPLQFKRSLNSCAPSPSPLQRHLTMDHEEVTLDWGANDDEDGIQHQHYQNLDSTRKEGLANKDEATLSGAESLLALAFGGASADPQDDKDEKDSDVVSLGGGEDDMEELYAYQSRTHLGGVTGGDPKSTVPSALSRKPTDGANSDERKSQKALAVPSSQATSTHTKSHPNELHSDSSKPRSKPSSQAKPQSSEHARSPSTSRVAPLTGPLGLPPKPVAAPTTPYVRPSHPSIMSASSMAAPPRERERDIQRDHDGVKGKHRLRSHSPESDGLSLAPGWETRRARDGTQDVYYYNTKTQQSTWSRRVATGVSSGSQSPIYSRGRAKDQVRSSGKDSPLAVGHDSGPQLRNRPSRFDTIRVEPNLPIDATLLSFEERHYRPNDVKSPPHSPPFENGDLRLQRQSRGDPGPPATDRNAALANFAAHAVSHRGTDRDPPPFRGVQTRDRDERVPPSFGDRVPTRNGEKRPERERSRSPGRGRGRIAWPNDVDSNVWGRDVALPSGERRVPAALDFPRQSFGDSSPHFLPRGHSQAIRSSSLGREERARYLPSKDQSSFRTLSPPTPSLSATSSRTEVKRRAGARKTPPRPSLEDSLLSSLDLFSCSSKQPKDAHHGLFLPLLFLLACRFGFFITPPHLYVPLSLSIFSILLFFRRQIQVASTAGTSSQADTVQIAHYRW
ncbi:hypothetical protein K439DRAFT_229362 [Ramaria rubella]|nr:hypothetical protein K439DRAFT_229362 [Ramaria rubella]